MQADLNKPSSDGETAAFLYVSGECVYDNGQVADYYATYHLPNGCYGAVAGSNDRGNVEAMPAMIQSAGNSPVY